MNYYEQLYDINFFSNDRYIAGAGSASVTIVNPGLPDWDTWRGVSYDADRARVIWERCMVNESLSDWIAKCRFEKNDDDDNLLCLVMCEEFYRRNQIIGFTICIRILLQAEYADLQLKAKKMSRAWDALHLLVPNQADPIGFVKEEALIFVNSSSDKLRDYCIQDVKVETPVREAWTRANVSFKERNMVESFYMHTLSYVLELTAANYQVETLFNYSIVIELLLKLKVRSLVDYGAGIGTFVELATLLGLLCEYSDLPSHTMEFAAKRIHNSSFPIKMTELSAQKYEVNSGADCVVCTEVLEHLYDPENLLTVIHNSMRPLGILVVSESYNYVDEFCAHLPVHKGKGNGVFLDFMKNIGFKRLDIDYTLHPSVHIKRK